MGFRTSFSAGYGSQISDELLGKAYKVVRAVEAKLPELETFLDHQEDLTAVMENIAVLVAIGEAMEDIEAAGPAATSAVAAAATATAQAAIATTKATESTTAKTAAEAAQAAAVTAKNTAETAATNAGTSASGAETSRVAAVAAAASATSSASTAAGHLSAIEALVNLFGDKWLGPYATEPTEDVDESPLDTGDLYWNTSLKQFGVYDEGTDEWIYMAAGSAGAAGLVTFAPAGGLSSFNVQDALYELDTEKAPKANPTFTGTVAGVTKAHVGLGSVDNTSDAGKPISTATQAALDTKQATIAAGLTTQFYRGDKTWQLLNKAAVGLGNVDNTADSSKSVNYANSAGAVAWGNISGRPNVTLYAWSDPGVNPAYLLGNDGTDTWKLYPMSRFSVTYAAGAGDSDTLDGQHGAFYQNAGNMNAGALPDARLSSNVITTSNPYLPALGALGSYVLAVQVSGTPTADGGSVAGSDLRPTTTSEFDHGAALSGTWRLMGAQTNNAGSLGSDHADSVFLRIA